MRQTGFPIVLIVILLLGAESCQLARLNDPIIVTDVAEEFYVDLIEDLTTEPRSLKFRLSTIKLEPCENYRIQLKAQRNASRLNLSISDIVVPDDCILGEAPAKAEANFGPLESGFYRLSIDLKQTVFNEGQLTASADRYLVSMVKKEGIVFLQQELLKVPVNTAWGYVTFESANDKPVADAFLAEAGTFSENHSLEQGYYGHFQILDADGRIVVSGQPATSQIRTFLYHLPRPGNRQALKDVIAAYRSQYAERIDIKVFTDLGEEL